MALYSTPCFFSNSIPFIQFAPIVERIGRHKEGTKLSSPEEQDAAIELAPFSVDSEKWGDLLCALFDEWLKEDVGKFYIQLFDSLHHLIERGESLPVPTVFVVELLRAIDRYTHQEIIFLEKLAPFVIQ